MGVEIADGDVALRCNLACVEGTGRRPPHQEPLRGSHHHRGGGGAHPAPSTRSWAAGAARCRSASTPGVSYRHLLVLPGGWASPAVECAPPHDHVGGRVADLLPQTRELTGEDPARAAATAERLRRALPARRADSGETTR